MIKTNWRAVLVGCVLLVPLCLWLFQSQQVSTREEVYVDMEQVQSVQQETFVKKNCRACGRGGGTPWCVYSV